MALGLETYLHPSIVPISIFIDLLFLKCLDQIGLSLKPISSLAKQEIPRFLYT